MSAPYASGLLASRSARTPEEVESAFDAFRASLEESRRSDERIGVHALIARRERERVELYERFLEMWRELKRERFRQRLETVVGIG